MENFCLYRTFIEHISDGTTLCLICHVFPRGRYYHTGLRYDWFDIYLSLLPEVQEWAGGWLLQSQLFYISMFRVLHDAFIVYKRTSTEIYIRTQKDSLFWDIVSQVGVGVYHHWRCNPTNLFREVLLTSTIISWKVQPGSTPGHCSSTLWCVIIFMLIHDGQRYEMFVSSRSYACWRCIAPWCDTAEVTRESCTT